MSSRALLGLAALTACGGSAPSLAPPVLPPPPQPPPLPAPVPTPEEPIYPIDEAITDALAGPLVHLGTGRWYGLHRSFACIYKNERVFVVIAYCAPSEPRAFRVDIFSPQRGRVSIYAEGNSPPSTLPRSAYFVFKADSQPAQPGLSLDMSSSQLETYERRRAESPSGSCFLGNQPTCTSELSPHTSTFTSRNSNFLSSPPDTWYRLLRELRSLSQRDGRSPSR